MERSLSAFKTSDDVVASVLTFLAARRGFAVTDANAATDALALLARALAGLKFVSVKVPLSVPEAVDQRTTTV
jgi:hypothetical protein